MSTVREILGIIRFHIMLIAFMAAIAFGWVMTGRHPWAIAAIGAFDWLLINLLNRATDLEEDLANGIPGSERVARARRPILAAVFGLMGASFVATHLLWPQITPLRLIVQAIGTAYSIPLVPTTGGMRRFKDIYFLKNFMSAVLFVCTVFLYVVATADAPPRLAGGWAALGLLVAFFVPFEITYEILYDMRDLEGDRVAGIPTYPVVHGLEPSRRIIDCLLVAASATIVAGLLLGWIGVREGLFLAAPGMQLLFYRPRYARGLTTRDCIVLTHVGSAQLALFVAGTQAWQALGLPENIYVV